MKFHKSGKLTEDQLDAFDKKTAKAYKEQFAVKEVSEALARRVLQLVDFGLSDGIGEGKPGEMCVEVAVSYAMGMNKLTDHPSNCVLRSASDTKIKLNDMYGWPDEMERAKGLRRIAVAQLGSNNIKPKEFKGRLILHLIQQVLLPYKAKEYIEKDDKSGSMDNLLASFESASSYKEMAKAYSTFTKNEAYHEHHCGRYYDSVIESFFSDGIDELMDTTENILPSYGKERHKGLLRIAKAIELALIDCRSQGVEWLYLTEPKKRQKAQA